MRTAEIKRKTKETDIEVFVKLDGEASLTICLQPLEYTAE